MAYNESNEYKERRREGGGKGMEANTFQPRCVAFTWRFVTLNNGTMASVFVPLICLCVSASSLSPPSIESRQLKKKLLTPRSVRQRGGFKMNPYQPARGAERERGSKTTVNGRISQGSQTPLKHFLSGLSHRKQCFHFLKAAEHSRSTPERCWHMN